MEGTVLHGCCPCDVPVAVSVEGPGGVSTVKLAGSPLAAVVSPSLPGLGICARGGNLLLASGDPAGDGVIVQPSAAASPSSTPVTAPPQALAASPAMGAVAGLQAGAVLMLSPPGGSAVSHDVGDAVPHPQCLAWSADGQLVFVGGNCGEIVALDVSGVDPAIAFALPTDNSHPCTALVPTPANETLLVGREGGDVEVWDLRRRQKLFSFSAPLGKGSVVRSMAVSDDSKQVAVLSRDGEVGLLAVS